MHGFYHINLKKTIDTLELMAAVLVNYHIVMLELYLENKLTLILLDLERYVLKLARGMNSVR